MVAAVARFASRNAVGLLALFVALGGTSYAVTAKTSKRFVGSDGQLHACVRPATGAIQLVHTGVRCRRGLQAIAWSQLGPRGAQGPAGAKGDAGPAGSIEGAPAGGDLTGSYPAPAIAPAEAPIAVRPNPLSNSDPCPPALPGTGVFCGTASEAWKSGAAPLQFWRDRLGEVHLRGQATPLGASPPSTVFVLPPAYRPPRPVELPIALGPNSVIFDGAAPALLVVTPSGAVTFLYGSITASDVFFVGEVEFRTDA